MINYRNGALYRDDDSPLTDLRNNLEHAKDCGIKVSKIGIRYSKYLHLLEIENCKDIKQIRHKFKERFGYKLPKIIILEDSL